MATRGIRYLTLAELSELHRLVIHQSGGGEGMRDFAGLESAIAQPRSSFGGQELYPSLDQKAAALCFSLVQNHPFIDGNKRIGHAAMETFLILNGFEISAPVDEAEKFFFRLAAGDVPREELVSWISTYKTPLSE